MRRLDAGMPGLSQRLQVLRPGLRQARELASRDALPGGSAVAEYDAAAILHFRQQRGVTEQRVRAAVHGQRHRGRRVLRLQQWLGLRARRLPGKQRVLPDEPDERARAVRQGHSLRERRRLWNVSLRPRRTLTNKCAINRVS